MPAFALICVALFAQTTADPPRVVDERLTLELFAAEPQITTPNGIAVDDAGRVLVVENNTHFRPKEYPRAEHDRILRLADTNGDGKADEIIEFYTGLKDTMNLARHPSGGLFVATRREVFRLDDLDGDGKAEKRTDLIRLQTDGNYPHNGLSGFAFGPFGELVFGFGENLGASYKLTGTDGKSLSGGGEGGNVYSCSLDGKNLRQVATGFWNPFHVGYDAFGRLFCVDNDPDSRPPCRLLHIVEGGDYGFKFRNGRKGVHPFTAWNGELPGTLPMVAGTGEAPCAVMAYESDNLPAEYRGDLLVTSWGDHRLERYTLKPRGASFSAEMKPVVTGDANFRPVGLALAPDGSLYFTDWVDKSYPVHNKGRIWRLKAKNPAPRVKPTGDPMQDIAHLHRPIAEAAASKLTKQQAKKVIETAESARARALAAAKYGISHHGQLPILAAAESAASWENYRKFLESPKLQDPFPQIDAEWVDTSPKELKAEAVRVGLASTLQVSKDPFEIQAAAKSYDGLVQTNSPSERRLLQIDVLQNIFTPNDSIQLDQMNAFEQYLYVSFVLPVAFKSPESLQRLINKTTARDALLIEVIAVAEGKHLALRFDIERILRESAQDRQLFEICLAALDRLDGAVAGGKNEPAGEVFALKLLLDPKQPVALRRTALRTLPVDHPGVTTPLLLELSRNLASTLRLDALRSLRLRGGDAAAERLWEVARDKQSSPAERLEAILGLPIETEPQRQRLQTFIAGDDPLLGLQALRTLAGDGFDRAARERIAAERKMPTTSPAGAEPKSLSEWTALAAGNGDADRGERLFFHPRLAACYKCHEYQGRGGRIGPDLTHYGKTATLERLVQSIVEPSREIAPQFTPFVMQTTDGQTKTGVYIGEEVDGTVRYADDKGAVFRLHPRDVEERQASAKSIMPEGIAQQLTAQELRDLAAFLLRK